jgi:hypothetical protein
VAVVRQSVCEWRPVVKDELLGVCRGALINRSLEGVVALPECENPLFNRRERWAWVYTLARGLNLSLCSWDTFKAFWLVRISRFNVNLLQTRFLETFT